MPAGTAHKRLESIVPAFRWYRVASQAVTQLARLRGDDQERVRLLRALEREAGDLAGTLSQPFHWPPKGAK
jgi:hypothetical protein